MKKQRIFIYVLVFILLVGVTVLLFLQSLTPNQQKSIDQQRELANNTSKANEFEDPTNNKTLQQWKQINPDTKAILVFAGKQMPVVKGKDNQEYLHKNIYGEEDFYGVPYFDKETYLDDDNLLIYGHSSSKKDLILTAVREYETQNNAEEAILITEQGTFVYEPFTFIKINQEDEDRFMGWLIHNWENEFHFAYYVGWMSNENYTKRWFVKDNQTYKKYLSLITCDLSQNDGRYILMMRLKD